MNLREFMDAVYAGWLQYTQGGMYLGLFFAALLFIWLVCYDGFGKEGQEGRKNLFLYTVGITGLILFPGTAFLLLKYQTAYYTYSQLFLLVPFVPVIAWSITEFFAWLEKNRKQTKGGKGQKRIPKWLSGRTWIYEVAAAAVFVSVVWMAGTLSAANEVTNQTVNDEKIPAKVLTVLQKLESGEGISLEEDVVTAPDEILEYARAYSGDIKLLYGRNMWQKELNAYTYDVYPEELEKVHDWLNLTMYGLRWVKPDITVEDAFEILEDSACTVLILTGGQFAEEEFKQVLEKSSFTFVSETEDYVILKKGMGIEN